MKNGFSLVEVILAVGIFMIIASGAVGVVLQAYNANRLSEEYIVANQYASEGIEAARSIKNQSFSNLSNTTGTGIVRDANGVWTLSGTNNTLAHNASNNYTRVLKIEEVRRDGSGNIVGSGGTVDPDTKKITSTVSWNFNNARSESLDMITYLSDWEKPISVVLADDGVLIYSDSTTVAQPKFRTYTESFNSFSSESSTGTSFSDSVVGETFEIQTNPTKKEAIAGYVNGSGVLRVLCYDGSNWTSEWTATVGGTAANDHRFAIAFEKTTGDAMVVYSTNATTNEMAYRTKPGSSSCGNTSWSSATNIEAAPTMGVVQWIRMENSPISSSNTIALLWADSNSDLAAKLWTGSSWGSDSPLLENNLERSSTSQDVLSFDLAFESLSGNLMVVWGLFQNSSCTAGTTIATTNCIRYARYTTSWLPVTVLPTVADPATNLDISSNPISNEIVMGALDNSQLDLSLAYWSGSSWTGVANVDTRTNNATAGSKKVTTAWTVSGATSRSIIVYSDFGELGVTWMVGNGANFTTQTPFTPTPMFNTPHQWFELFQNPKTTESVMLFVGDTSSYLHAKRLFMAGGPTFFWTNSDGSVPLETSLGQYNANPLGFAYWRNP